MAFQLNDQMGGGTVVEGNVAFSMVMETQDSGVMHQWGRHPYLTNLNRDHGYEWSLAPALNRITRNLFVGNGAKWTYGRAGRRFAIETDDASSYIRFDHNVFAYGSTDSWLGHDLSMDNNLLVRVDLSGTDNPAIDSPTCVWSLFNSSYWDALGGRNLSFVNTHASASQAISTRGGSIRRWASQSVWTHRSCTPTVIRSSSTRRHGRPQATASSRGMPAECV